MSKTTIRLLAAALVIPCHASAQSANPDTRLSGYVIFSQAPTPGHMIYEDREDGYRFEYPAFLHPDGILIFRNPDSLNAIYLHIQIASADPKSYLNLSTHDAFTFESAPMNGLNWVKYSYSGGAGYYIYQNREEVSIEAIAHAGAKELSDAELQALYLMASTFTFTDLASRMDSRVSALKPGDKLGNLTVSRVVTSEMADGNHKKYWSNPLGEVDFDGTLTLKGFIVNNQTMNSYPDWVIGGPDPSNLSELPQVGYPFDFNRVQYPEIHLRNGDLVTKQIQKNNFADNEITIVADQLAEIFYPGSAPFLAANFLKIVTASPNSATSAASIPTTSRAISPANTQGTTQNPQTAENNNDNKNENNKKMSFTDTLKHWWQSLLGHKDK